MPRYVALLGSINVGGNRLSMADLRDALGRDKFERVETVVASGNVLFDHDKRPVGELGERIARVVADRFGISSLAVVLDRAALARSIADNPFHGEGPGHGEDKFVHTIFLDGQPDPEAFANLQREHSGKGSERLALGERMLFLDYVHGAGVSSLTGAFLERRLKCRGTARNMRSLKRILGRMEAAHGA